MSADERFTTMIWRTASGKTVEYEVYRHIGSPAGVVTLSGFDINERGKSINGQYHGVMQAGGAVVSLSRDSLDETTRALFETLPLEVQQTIFSMEYGHGHLPSPQLLP